METPVVRQGMRIQRQAMRFKDPKNYVFFQPPAPEEEADNRFDEEGEPLPKLIGLPAEGVDLPRPAEPEVSPPAIESPRPEPNEMLTMALAYCEQGLSVIPVRRTDKQPRVRWRPFQQRKADESQIRAWWNQFPDANLAIVTGQVSGLVVLDIDSPEGEAALAGKPLPLTPTVRTGRGKHFYFQHPGFPVRSCAGILTDVDIRGEAGYVIAPPSIHVSGVEYTWTVKLGEAALAAMPPWLVELIKAADQELALEKSFLAPTKILEIRTTLFVWGSDRKNKIVIEGMVAAGARQGTTGKLHIPLGSITPRKLIRMLAVILGRPPRPEELADPLPIFRSLVGKTLPGRWVLQTRDEDGDLLPPGLSKWKIKKLVFQRKTSS